MTRRQLTITVSAVLAALVVGVVATVVATSGDDGNQSVNAPGGTTTPTTAPPVTTAPTTPTTTKPTTAPPTSTTITPGTVVINPPVTTVAPTTRPPTTPPTTVAPTRPTTSTTRPTTTTSHGGGSPDVGITPTEIRVAVISDSPDAIAGTRAWAEWVNRRNGIAGRRIRVDTFDGPMDPTKYATAVKTACAQDFAIVGTFATADDQTTELERCGIPDLPARTNSDAHAQAANTFAAVPARATSRLVGGYKWLLDHVPGCCAQYAILPTAPDQQAEAMRQVDAANSVGFTLTDTAELTDDAVQADYNPIVQAIVQKQANLAWSFLGYQSTVNLRKAALGKNVAGVKAWFCLDQCYTHEFLTAGGAAVNGEYVQIEVNPFEESRSIPAMASYLRYTKKDGATPTVTGEESFAAGMLFEQVARQVVTDNGSDGLTRVALIAALHGVHTFTAGGILGATDVAEGTPNGCFAVLQVRSKHFARIFPATRATLSCGQENLLSTGR
ncbi:MAG TPA: ABC transporter substrate-binding protein [Acidimicrobiia bacterium]|nr:ABC transporter substrate-binding protein [Acidimicrobiia bacterium]